MASVLPSHQTVLCCKRSLRWESDRLLDPEQVRHFASASLSFLICKMGFCVEMVHVRWLVPGTHLVNRKNPCTECKWVKEGSFPEPQPRKQMKRVHRQPGRGLGGSSSVGPGGSRCSCPRWRPAAGMLLYGGHSASPQGLC